MISQFIMVPESLRPRIMIVLLGDSVGYCNQMIMKLEESKLPGSIETK